MIDSAGVLDTFSLIAVPVRDERGTPDSVTHMRVIWMMAFEPTRKYKATEVDWEGNIRSMNVTTWVTLPVLCCPCRNLRIPL
jgi:hypothetical protein